MKEKKKKVKSLAKIKSDLQEIFNTYIRKRDNGQPCISCGQYKTLQAGHFYTVKMYDGLRFDEDNVNGECAGCNCFDDMHLLGYRDNLVRKIGEERFNALVEKAADYKKNGYKWTRSELLEKIVYYKEKLAQLDRNI